MDELTYDEVVSQYNYYESIVSELEKQKSIIDMAISARINSSEDFLYSGIVQQGDYYDEYETAINDWVESLRKLNDKIIEYNTTLNSRILHITLIRNDYSKRKLELEN